MTNLFKNILLLQPDEIEGDISIAESAYNLLSELSLDDTLFIGDLDDTFRKNQLRILKVWQTVLRVKGEQAEVAIKEFLSKARESDSQIQVLTQQLVATEGELIGKQKQIDKFNINQNIGRLVKDDKPILFDKKYNDLIIQLESYNAQLMSERNTNQSLNSELQIQKIHTKQVMEESKLVELEYYRYKEQLQEQKEGMIMQRNNEEVIRERLSSRTQEYSELLDVIGNLKTNCDELTHENGLLKLQIQQAISDLDIMANVNKALEEHESESVRQHERITNENIFLHDQLKDLKFQLSNGTECNDDILKVVDNKTKEWSSLLIEKELLLETASQRIETLQAELNNTLVVNGLNQVDTLSVSLKEKDNRINVLERELSKAILDIEKVSKIKSEKLSVQDIQDLMNTDVGDQIESERELRLRAEKSASHKDELYAKTLTELKKIESVDFSLYDALTEIKHCRKQIIHRDEDIAKLISQMNDLVSHLSLVEEENAAFKFNNGIVCVDMVPLRDERALKIQYLTKERDRLSMLVDSLGATVVDLKKNIGLMSHREKDLTSPFINLTDGKEIEISDHYLDVPQRLPSTSEGTTREQLSKGENSPPYTYGNSNQSVLIDSLMKKIVMVESEYGKLLEQNQIVKENSSIEEGEYEKFISVIQDVSYKLNRLPSGLYEQDSFLFNQLRKSVDQILVLLEMKNCTKDCNKITILYLRSQVSQLQEQLSSLIGELNSLRKQKNTQMFGGNINTKSYELCKVQTELGTPVSTDNQRVSLRGFHQGLCITSSELCCVLYGHLLEIIADKNFLEKKISRMQLEVVNFEKRLSDILYQQGSIYRDHLNKRDVWNSEEKDWIKQKDKFCIQNEKDKILLEEFYQLKGSLSDEPNELRTRLEELLSKFSVLRYSEQTLHRKYSIQKLKQTGLEREIVRLTDEIKCIESTVAERISYLNRFKEAATYKIASLQSEVEDSVSLNEHSQLNREYSNLCKKYELTLNCDSTYFIAKKQLDNLESENTKLILHIDQLKDKLISKESKFLLSESSSLQTVTNTINDTNASKVDHLECLILNEKQRADLYQLRFEQCNQMLTTVENRNMELEQNYSTLTGKYLLLQETQQELRDELLQSLPFEDAEEHKIYIHDLENKCADLTNECEKLKSIADISKGQSDSLSQQISDNDNELSTMRDQLINLQAESNEALIVGKLHLEISHLQVCEGITLQRLSKAKNHGQSLQSKLFQLQKTSLQRENCFYRSKTELVKRIKRIQTYNQSLVRKLSNSTHLVSQEKLISSMKQLNLEKEEASKLVKETREAKYQLDLKQAEFEHQKQHMIELMHNLCDGKSFKIRELHNKLGDYKLNELRLYRQLARVEFQLSEEKKLSQQNEQSLIVLEEELAAVAKEKETIQAEWEHRESKLENRIEENENYKEGLLLPGVEELLVDALPDPTAPLNEQLDHSCLSLRKFGSLLISLKLEKERVEKELNVSLSHAFKMEDELLIKERENTELQLRIPDFYLGETQAEPEKLFEYDRQLKLAQNTIQSMQNLLSQREATIEKYQEKLQDARAESEKLIDSHRQELEFISSKLCTQSDSTIKRLKEVAKDAINTTKQLVIPQDHRVMLKEKEELIQELEREKVLMIDENKIVKSLLKEASDEQIRTKQVCHDEANKDIAEHATEITKLTDMVHQLEKNLIEKELEIEVIEGEVSTLKEASKQPLPRIMRNQVNRLRQELALKDNDNQTLKEALLQARSELVYNADQAIMQETRGAEQEQSLHVIVCEKTSEYKQKLEKANLKNEHTNNALTKMKEKICDLEEEISKLKRQLNKLNSNIGPIRETEKYDNKKLEKELEQEKIIMNKNITNLNKTRDVLKQENNELKSRNNTIEKDSEQMKKYIKELEYFKTKQMKSESKVTGQVSEEMSKWEEGKKWQKKVETQKLRYSEKVHDFDNAQRQIQSLKSLLEKSDRDKSILQNRLKQVEKPSMLPPIEENKYKEIQELKSELFAIQNEKNILERSLVLDRDIKLQELRSINDTLKLRIETLEFKIVCPEETRFEQDNSLQDLLECQKENIRLNFDIEESQKEIPRLMGRIAELESFNENLQTDNDIFRNEKERNEKLSSGTNKAVPLPKQILDLERVITSMKRVIENLQNENNSLKKQFQSKEIPKLSELQKENRRLRAEAEGCKEENRKNIIQKQVEIDQLKKQTGKKAEKVEKQLNTELESMQSQLKVKEKQYSDILKELNRKSTILLEVKKHLKIAADRESEIIREKEVLQEQIKFFENLTSGNQGLKKLGEKFQQARQEILDFENERESLVKSNAELKREIKGLKEVRLLDNEITNTAELQNLTAENERLLSEVGQLKRELNSIDPSFFEEIEDLKFNFKKSVQKNILYEEHVAMLTTKYGVPPPDLSLVTTLK